MLISRLFTTTCVFLKNHLLPKQTLQIKKVNFDFRRKIPSTTRVREMRGTPQESLSESVDDIFQTRESWMYVQEREVSDSVDDIFRTCRRDERNTEREVSDSVDDIFQTRGSWTYVQEREVSPIPSTIFFGRVREMCQKASTIFFRRLRVGRIPKRESLSESVDGIFQTCER